MLLRSRHDPRESGRPSSAIALLLSEHQGRSLQEIIDNIAAIKRHVGVLAAQDFETFAATEIVIDAVERCLSRISEAAVRLGEEAEVLVPGQPWREIRGLGNQLRHEYHDIALMIIWEIIVDDLDPLDRACRAAISSDGN